MKKDIIIPTIEDCTSVLLFFIYISEQLSVTFHPDTPFEDYVEGRMAKRSFTPTQAKQLNKAMDQCFVACSTTGIDIYQVAMDRLTYVGAFLPFEKRIKAKELIARSDNEENEARSEYIESLSQLFAERNGIKVDLDSYIASDADILPRDQQKAKLLEFQKKFDSLSYDTDEATYTMYFTESAAFISSQGLADRTVNEHLEDWENPTFEEFVASRRVISDKAEIAKFFFDLFGDPDFKKEDSVVTIKSLYLYQGDYWLTEDNTGDFSTYMNYLDEPTGTLAEIEDILYKYAYVND